MRETYTIRVRYNIFGDTTDMKAIENAYYCLHPLPECRLIKIKKDNKDTFDTALHRLSSERMFGGKDMTTMEYREFLSECMPSVSGIIEAKIRYNRSGYVTISLTYNHFLSEEDKMGIEDDINAQLVDGYDENPFHFAKMDGKEFYLAF